ncbi:glycosyltransferase [Halopseudomonas nanhaiensis]|uniref:glycosyltransferase n=1 Tax=Halopseudomonas nanhaiensis TaxID=2830842 RepID=UPI001CBE715D|nr:glycosyltransferase [Halopseudomonas nanhaiensis]UAW99094.1 glycosyltransferase [Halopseudomonas nanhaiensis]
MNSVARQRVLQICHSYYGPFLDCARQYAALFNDTQYDVTTVFLTGRADQAVVTGCASDEVIFLEQSAREVRGLKLQAIRRVREIVEAGRYSLCIAHRAKPIYVACVATRLPVIGVHHAFGVYNRIGRRLFARFFRERLMLFAVSDAVRKDIKSKLPGWPEEKLRTFWNRIDVREVQDSQVDRSAARQRLGLREKAWVVANVGRLHADKDQATLLKGFAKALSSLPSEATLVIIGSGKLDEQLAALADSLGIAERVEFLGQIPEARKFFRAFDVFALTSDHEPFGMVLLEAMAAGNALICTDCGGAPEVVGECGETFPYADAAALSDLLIQVSRQDDHKRIELQMQMQSNLITLFSDQAARDRFWKLPGLCVVTSGKQGKA